jgi:hypothetical protein
MPEKATKSIIEFLIQTYNGIPFGSSLKTTISARMGKTNANQVQQTDPINDKSSEKFGTNNAIAKTKSDSKLRNNNSDIIGCFEITLNCCLNEGYITSIGT